MVAYFRDTHSSPQTRWEEPMTLEAGTGHTAREWLGARSAALPSPAGHQAGTSGHTGRRALSSEQ